MYHERIKKVQAFLKAENLDGLVVTRAASLRYLCGFSSPDGVLVVRTSRAGFFTDFRYIDQSRQEVRGAKVTITAGDCIGALKEQKQLQGRNLRYGYEPEYLTCDNLTRIQNGLAGALLIPVNNAVEQFAVTKDATEVGYIRKAAEIADTAFERILNYIRPGIRENEVRAELEYQMMTLGSEHPAFETIIASGRRSAMPHGVASEKKIAMGDFLTLDFGATYKGYCCDITRTVVIGKANSRQKKIYGLVLSAQKAAIKKVKAGVSGKEIDAAARNLIDKAGFKKNFGHGTGHGIGLFIHSKPNVNAKSQDIMKRGMVITIEPGIYISGWGGVRIEDDVVVTTTGGSVLNKAPKFLLEI
jgi:Xaa-Pro aminopeptidase